MTRKQIIILIAAILLASPLHSEAQTANAKLDHYISLILKVRSSKSSREALKKELSADNGWTLMDETKRSYQTQAAGLKESNRFMINSILDRAERNRTGVRTRHDMLNGEKGAYKYSIYEQSVEAGKSRQFDLRKRSGEQIFVVIPYEKSADISIECKVDGTTAATAKNQNGILIAKFSVPTSGDHTVDLVVNATDSKKPVSYVILNYNSRGK